MMNIQTALNQAVLLLQPLINSADAKTDAEYLLSKILDKNFTWLKTWPEYELSEQQQAEYSKMLQRRKNGEPIAYILKEKAFWTLDLETNSSTLIPRPETELLVEQALEVLAEKQAAKTLDLGTGTGAIALSIAAERRDDDVYACDYNQDAVDLAWRNAKNNKIQNITIIQSDWFSNIKEKNFDLIVSNPPYIEANDPHLNQGDLIFEPNSALESADEGLADIKLIIKQSKICLKNDGCLMLEHGFEQGQRVRDVFSSHGYVEVSTIQDLAGLDRVTMGYINN